MRLGMNRTTNFLNSFSMLRFTGLLGLCFLILPVLIVIPMSFSDSQYLKFPPSGWALRWYINLFTNIHWYEPLMRSLTIAAIVAIISIVLGLCSAYGLYHTHSKGKSLVIFSLLLPLFVPPVVLAVGLLLIFSKVHLVDTIWGVALSHIMLALPYSFLIASAALSRANMKLEDVACSLGASRLYAFLKVTVPQLRSGMIAAGILSFVVSFDEPVLALFITSSQARTLPRQMFDGIRYDLDPTAAAVSSVLILISLLIAVFGVKK